MPNQKCSRAILIENGSARNPCKKSKLAALNFRLSKIQDFQIDFSKKWLRLSSKK